MRILVSDSLSQQGLDLLSNEEDFEVDFKTNLIPDELVERIGDYDALIIRSATRVTDKVYRSSESFKSYRARWRRCRQYRVGRGNTAWRPRRQYARRKYDFGSGTHAYAHACPFA